MRALLLILDSVGVGAAADAPKYGDQRSDTLGHILERHPGLKIPALHSLGLREILARNVLGQPSTRVAGSYGRMTEVSRGKDTTTGHWEIAGVQLSEPFATFEKFPAALVESIERDARVTFLGNYAQSGTTILDELGPEHVASGKPILYTSADSVLQIAAHEEVIPPRRLAEICRVARRHADAYRIGRVIARPFTGEPGAWRRTAGRRDYSLVPPRTILNAIAETGLVVHGVGKISDIFAGSGVTQSHPTKSNEEGMAEIARLWDVLPEGLIFANLVDFDALYGHRRDVDGYARALEEFDAWLGDFLKKWEREDLIIITADHGNDPTFRGTDHTREEVPLLVKYDGQTGPIGVRETFADVAATLADYFRLAGGWPVGESFLRCPPQARR